MLLYLICLYLCKYLSLQGDIIPHATRSSLINTFQHKLEYMNLSACCQQFDLQSLRCSTHVESSCLGFPIQLSLWKLVLCLQEYCYKMSVWTDFGQGQGQDRYRQQYYYQSITEKGHVTWKSCEMISQAQNGLEWSRMVYRSRRVYEARRAQTMMSGSMYTTLLPHVVYMDVRAGCTVLHSHCGVDMRQT